MGCSVNMNSDLRGQNFICQKHDPLSKEKKQWNPAYFSIKCSEPCRKKTKNLVNTHGKTTELASLTLRE